MTTTAEISALRDRFSGQVLEPEDPGYDRDRAIFNSMIDKRPAVIARCTGVADVLAALRFGIDHGLRVAVRGGGHNVAGTAVCDDGIVIDLSGMKGMR
ncbi:MAG: FAD-binding oxidoreductase, partial [Micromonosporaceae bacterium]